MFADGRLRTSAMAHNRDGASLIRAGEIYEYKRQLNNTARPSGGGFAPETPPNQTLLITAAVFDDGTYEGDARSAAQYRALALGDRTQLAQLVANFNQALRSTEPDVKLALESLREQVNALGTEADPPAINKLLRDFTGVADKAFLKSAIEVSMFQLKQNALKEIDTFGQKQDSDDNREALRAWLTYNRDRYQRWHDRLKKLN
jgi:FtsZ-binding cell division protein ZapB